MGNEFVYSPPSTPYLRFLHVDEHIIVVNKPSGLLSVSGRIPAHQDSVSYRVTRVYPFASIVHRLDMATSGIIVLARNLAAHRHLSYQFAQRLTHKRYYAVLYGEPPNLKGIVNIPLNVDYPNRPKQKVDWKEGKPSVTCYQVRGYCEKGPLVELHPITGRSHQLRVHMRELGCPILGDRLYSPKESIKRADRLHLHAQSISFIHPLHGKRVSFSCPLEFASYLPTDLSQTHAEAKDLLKSYDINLSEIEEE